MVLSQVASTSFAPYHSMNSAIAAVSISATKSAARCQAGGSMATKKYTFICRRRRQAQAVGWGSLDWWQHCSPPPSGSLRVPSSPFQVEVQRLWCSIIAQLPYAIYPAVRKKAAHALRSLNGLDALDHVGEFGPI